MKPADVVKLCRLVKACCPSQQFDEYTPDAWAIILADVDHADAQQAVKDLVKLPLEPGKARYVEPGHIIGTVQRIRARRLEITPMPSPPAGLDPADYADWHARTREAIASGTYQAPAAPEIPPTEPGRFRELLAAATPSIASEPEHLDRRRRPDVVELVDQAQLDAERARQQAALTARIHQDDAHAEA